MKKITLLSLLMATGYGFAQDDCATALPLVEGTTTVSTFGTVVETDCSGYDGSANQALPNGGSWFVYTPTVETYLQITTDLDINLGGDTALNIYTGTCDGLTCFGFVDDVDLQGGNYLTTVGFAAQAGVTYYFVWDDRWSDAEFDFEVTATVPDCTFTGFPYSTDFDNDPSFYICNTIEDVDGDGISFLRQDLDLDQDGTFETFATSGTSSDNDKDDYLFLPGMPLAANGTYTISITYNGAGAANESFDLVWSTSDSTGTLTTVGSVSDVTMNGDFAELENQAMTFASDAFTPPAAGTYYPGVHMTSLVGGAFMLIFNMTVTESLSTRDLTANTFSAYPNPTKSMLNVVMNESIDSIQIFDLLGHQVLNQKVDGTTAALNVSEFATGTYVIKAQTANGTQVSKFVKS